MSLETETFEAPQLNDEEVGQNLGQSKDFDETFTVAFYNCGLQFDTSSKPFRPMVHQK